MVNILTLFLPCSQSKVSGSGMWLQGCDGSGRYLVTETLKMLWCSKSVFAVLSASQKENTAPSSRALWASHYI